MYDTYQHKIAECDRELEATLKQFAAPERASTEQPKIPNAKKTKRIQRNAPGFNLTSELHRITGVDLWAESMASTRSWRRRLSAKWDWI